MEKLEEAWSITAPEQLCHLGAQRAIMINGDIGPLDRKQERALASFVEQGGGLVCVAEAAEAYREYELLGEVLGHIHGMCTPRSEIIARAAHTDHYLTRRIDPAFAVLEAVYLLDILPPDAEVAWRTTWQHASYTLAYTCNYGRGRVVCIMLGSRPETWEHPVFQQIVARATRYAAGASTEESPARVALIGYGAIGFEHGTAISQVPGLELALVCDRNEERLLTTRAAFPGVQTCTDLAYVMEDPTIDLVIVSTPPDTHAAISMRMLHADKHVVTEKPFCLTTVEADQMIQLAGERQRALTIYQCRRWDPDYLAIQQLRKQGTIGEFFHIETFIGGYAHPCDYWHSHEPISGGVFYDWGSHYLDWILNLIPDPVVSVRGVEHKRVWHDVTNADHSSVYLRFAGGQEAEFMHSDIAAALKPKWYILGEQGAIVGEWRHESVKTRRWSGDLIEERLAPSEALPAMHVFTRGLDGAIHEQRLTLPQPSLHAFHRNLANHLHCGEALAIPPQEARRTIMVMEAAKRSAEREGEVIALEC
ncbi:MAG: Gfo/Idh/MocA family oxidoreductase [Ktedonobacteraceae bacterium]